MKNEVNRALVAKKKLTILFALLTLSAGLWAETVSYLCPVYNDPQNVTKGIQKWETKTADATEITNASATLAAGWYVVKGTDVQTGTLTCQGAVHIILADGAKLTATGNGDMYNPDNSTPGIQVSGGASLTIYAQSMGDQMGQLKATCGFYGAGADIGGGFQGTGSNITINGGTVTATGGDYAAGIGGGFQGTGPNITINGGIVTATGGGYYAAGIGGGSSGSGSNITINGGKVTATGRDSGAGIGGGSSGSGSNITINGGEVIATGGKSAAGIGGGDEGDGTNITITGGTVIATGGNNAAGIGGGNKGSGSNIKVVTYFSVKAGNEENPTEEIATDHTDDTDIANDLAGKQYATTEINFSKYKTIVIAAVNAEITESDNDNVKAIATSAATAINAATTVAEVNTLKSLAIANIHSAIAAYNDGKTEVLGSMGDECTDCTAVKVTNGTTTVTLYNATGVDYEVIED